MKEVKAKNVPVGDLFYFVPSRTFYRRLKAKSVDEDGDGFLVLAEEAVDFPSGPTQFHPDLKVIT